MAIDQKLINELNKLSKRANQRILEIERLTKRKSPQFAVKELADYLENANALTKRKGKSIRASKFKKSMTETDVVGAINALNRFLENKEGSSASRIKKYITKMEKKLEVKLKPHEASLLYIASREWQWIEDYTNGSEFWKYYDYEFKKDIPTEEAFITYLKEHLFDKKLQIDEDLKQKLKDLRAYLMKDL